jgi:hypothetical protein
MQIKSTSIISRNPQILSSKMDEEIIMMSVQNSEYYGVNPVGAYIWQMLEQPCSIENIIEMLVNEYDVNKEQCMNDIIPFLIKLEEKKIISISY